MFFRVHVYVKEKRHFEEMYKIHKPFLCCSVFIMIIVIKYVKIILQREIAKRFLYKKSVERHNPREVNDGANYSYTRIKR